MAAKSSSRDRRMMLSTNLNDCSFAHVSDKSSSKLVESYGVCDAHPTLISTADCWYNWSVSAILQCTGMLALSVGETPCADSVSIGA
jgi:hypothetical protein